MSAATVTPAQAPASGATSAPGHVLGTSLRAVRIFTSVAFSVAVLGRYADKDMAKDTGTAGILRLR